MAGYAGRGRRPSNLNSESTSGKKAESKQKMFPNTRDGMVIDPFAKQASQTGYYYFDLNYITRSMELSVMNCRKAVDMIEAQDIVLDNVQEGYLNDFSEGMALHVEGYYYSVNYLGKRIKQRVLLQVFRDRIATANCDVSTCPFYNNYYHENLRPCSHVISLLFLLEDYIIEHNPGDATSWNAGAIIDKYRHRRANTAMARSFGERKELKIEPRMENTPAGFSISFRTGIDKLYVVKDLTDFVSQVDNGETVKFGKNTEIPFGLCRMDDQSQRLFDFIKAVVMDRQDKQKRMNMKRSSYYYEPTVNLEVKANIELSGARLDDFFSMMKGNSTADGSKDSSAQADAGYGRPFEYVDKADKTVGKRMLVCSEGLIKPELTIEPIKDDREVFQGIKVTGYLPQAQEGAEAYYVVDLDKNCLLRMDKEKMGGILPLYERANQNHQMVFSVGRKHLSEFYYSILPVLKKYCIVTETDADTVEPYVPEEAQFRFYLDVEDNEISCRAEADYGDEAMSLMDANDDDKRMYGDLIRDYVREDEALFHVTRYFPMPDEKEDLFYCERDEESVYNLLNHGVEELMEFGEVHSTDRFQRLRIRRAPKVTVGVSVQSGIMNLSVSSDDLTQEEMLEVLSQYKRKKKFIRLKNGDFIDMGDDSLEALGELMDSMQVSPREFVKGKMQLPAYRALYLDKMLEESSGIYSRRDSHFRKLVKEFKTVNDSDFEVPESLQDTLRNYQITGYKWLRTLAAYGFGGILADDMGLGKT
ncbi:MAG: SNF2 helicase associated domain-containing protein, partial [Clostridiales bacterium]|nr:SNF2 helicase associated domain-containing protein [Clostridiales bacterium]